MSKVMLVIDEPKSCGECCFVGPIDYIRDFDSGENVYRRVGTCKCAPESVEDPWNEVSWLLRNKPDWCPLKPVEEV